MRIWKYGAPEPGSLRHHMIPAGGQFLSVQMQGDLVQMWFLVDPSQRMEQRTFAMCGTGSDVEYLFDPRRAGFLGTVLDGPFVWHAFEVL